MDFGYTLRTMRKAAGISLRNLAKQIGVSAAYLSQVERGTLPPPTARRLDDIAKILHIPSTILLSLTDRLTPEQIGYLKTIPEITHFLHLAKENSLTGEEFQMLSNFLSTYGKESFSESLEKIHNKQIKQKQPSELKNSKRVMLSNHLDKQLLWPQLQVESKEELLYTLSEGINRVHPEVATDKIYKCLASREKESSTGIGKGIAVPHASIEDFSGECVAVATLLKGIEFNAIDNCKVKVIFLFVGNESSRYMRLKLLARVARLGLIADFTEKLCQVETKDNFLELLFKFDNRVH